MRSRINRITLVVDQLERARAFYGDGLDLDLGGGTEADDHVVFSLDGQLELAIWERKALASHSDVPDAAANPTAVTVVLTQHLDSMAEVDLMLSRATAAGAHVVDEPHQLEMAYIGRFRDPDGHLWEIQHNPEHVDI